MKQLFLSILFVSTLSHVMAQVKTVVPIKHDISEIWEPEVKMVSPGKTQNEAPSDAIILFDGKNLSREWTNQDGDAPGWVVADGCATVVNGVGDIKTKRNFNDFQLHIEWRSPAEVVGEGQGRGNSGIFLQGLYEVQVLDNFNNRTYRNGQAGSIYKQYAPLVNAYRGPGEWQVYDIIYTAPRFRADSTYFTQPYVTLIYNGILVQNHVAVRGPSAFGIPEYFIRVHGAGPIMLQNHKCQVSYRNIWIREL